jgi:hypothetical protein
MSSCKIGIKSLLKNKKRVQSREFMLLLGCQYFLYRASACRTSWVMHILYVFAKHKDGKCWLHGCSRQSAVCPYTRSNHTSLALQTCLQTEWLRLANYREYRPLYTQISQITKHVKGCSQVPTCCTLAFDEIIPDWQSDLSPVLAYDLIPENTIRPYSDTCFTTLFQFVQTTFIFDDFKVNEIITNQVDFLRI